MPTIEELIAMYPQVLGLREALEQERRHHAATRQERDNATAIIAQLRASLIALRDAHRRDKTPPMDSASIDAAQG